MKLKNLLEKAVQLPESKREEAMEVLERHFKELNKQQKCELEEHLDFVVNGPELTKEAADESITEMYNDAGEEGRHFTHDEIKQIASTKGINFSTEDFNEFDFDWAVHMFYYDQNKFLKKIATDRSKILDYCAELALGFLDDPDAPNGGKGKAKKYIYAMKD